MNIKRIEVTQTKWSTGMQDFITFGVEYISYPILNDYIPRSLCVIGRESFWKLQGDILGSIA